MYLRRLRAVAVCLVTVALVIGCSKDGTGPGDTISDSEAQTMAVDALNLAIAGLNSGTPASAALAGEPTAINFQYFHRVYCEVSGRSEVSGSLTGSFDSETGSGTAWLQLLMTWTDCTLSNENGGQIVLNGDPYLTLTGTFSWLNYEPATQQTLRLGGSLRRNSTSCFFDVTMTVDYSTGGSTASGTVCGRQINLSTS